MSDLKIIKKFSLEGIWHWLRFKEVKKPIKTIWFQQGRWIGIQKINHYEYVFEPRRWYNSLRRKQRNEMP